MTRNQINLKDEAAYKTLQHLAARLGYLTVGSAAHGEGSIRQMLLAVARGELSIARPTKGGDAPPEMRNILSCVVQSVGGEVYVPVVDVAQARPITVDTEGGDIAVRVVYDEGGQG